MERGVHFGGNANNESKAGFVYSNTNNVPSNTNTNIGSRKCFHNITTDQKPRVTALPLGKRLQANLIRSW